MAVALKLGRPFGNVQVFLSPHHIAAQRAARIKDATAYERDMFIAWFQRGRADELKGADTWWIFRDMLDTWQDVSLAGYLEGIASVHADRVAVNL